MDQDIFRQMREVEDHHWWFAARRNILKHVLSSLEIPSRARILDVGCGTGGNLKLLSEFGEVIGAEHEARAVAVAQARQAGQVVKGSLPEAMPFAAEQFDLIVLLDVLEHIEDDSASLNALDRLLAPGGYLVITVPAFMFLWSRHDIAHHHQRRYTARELRERVQQARFEIEHVTYFNSLLFPAIAMVRMLERMLPSRTTGMDLTLPNKIVNMVLQAILSSERHFVTWAAVPFGVSLLAIARKLRP